MRSGRREQRSDPTPHPDPAAAMVFFQQRLRHCAHAHGGGWSPWWRGWSRSCDDGHVTTLAGRPYGDLGGALPRVKPIPPPPPPPTRMY